MEAEWQDNDLVWVFNFSLLMVPKKLRRRLRKRDLRLGLFLHTPFPSNELYRVVPHRRELLEGMLGADLIGFNTFSYSRHFLSACGLILGLDSDIMSVTFHRHTSHLKTLTLGADPDKWARLLETAPVQRRFSELSRSFRGMRVRMAHLSRTIAWASGL